MKMLPGFEATWQVFSAEMLDATLGERSRAMARQLFYAGGIAAFEHMTEALSQLPAPEAKQSLCALQAEFEAFMKQKCSATSTH